MVPFINPANHAPGVQIGHTPGVLSAKISFTYLRTYSNILMTCWLSGERSLPFGLLVLNCYKCYFNQSNYDLYAEIQNSDIEILKNVVDGIV